MEGNTLGVFNSRQIKPHRAAKYNEEAQSNIIGISKENTNKITITLNDEAGEPQKKYEDAKNIKRRENKAKSKNKMKKNKTILTNSEGDV